MDIKKVVSIEKLKELDKEFREVRDSAILAFIYASPLNLVLGRLKASFQQMQTKIAIAKAFRHYQLTGEDIAFNEM